MHSDTGDVWWPDPPDAVLTAQYGDWRTPRPEWDSLVSCRALQETNLQWRCWSYKRLSDQWRGGGLRRARGLLEQILARAPGDPQLLSWRDVLDAAAA